MMFLSKIHNVEYKIQIVNNFKKPIKGIGVLSGLIYHDITINKPRIF